MMGKKGAVRVVVDTEAAGSYPVFVGTGILGHLPHHLRELAPAHRYVLIADERVMDLYGDRVEGLLTVEGMRIAACSFPEGEKHKTRGEWARLSDELLELGLGRDGCVLALGGGVTGDLAGFVAATYMRGIPVVQIPTSLVAMVDSSVGGKTGVDVPLGKNLVGAFHPPRFVLADAALARSLPARERSQGLAEAVKHGAILDRDYLDRVTEGAPQLLHGDEEITARMVARSVEIKAGVVSRDEREGGLRQILNFGHTLGHSLEAASGYGIPHGTAVGLGMVLEARLGERLGVTASGTSRVLEDAVKAVGLPHQPPVPVEAARILAHLGRDKKGREGQPRFVLLDRPGRVHRGSESPAAWSHPVPMDAVRGVLQDFSGQGI